MTRNAVLLTLLIASFASAAGADERPNILFIMSDDHGAQAIGAYGMWLAEQAPTPRLDRLAAEGMLFRNCFVTNSICTPSRAAIYTGKYAHRNGVYKFTPMDHRQPTLPKLLRAAGYHTATIGKYHLHSNPVGFDYWSILPGQGRYHDPEFVEMDGVSDTGLVRKGARTQYKGHVSDVIGDKAIEYLKSARDKSRPFFLMYHFKAPHDPFQYAPRYEKLFADVDLPEPPTLFDDYDGRSDALRTTTQFIGSPKGRHTVYAAQTGHLQGEARKRAQYQIYVKSYLRCVAGVDHNVGRVLDYLEASGLAENTIVVYTSDQGFYLGEHGLYDKRFMYEPALRMPLLIRWPKRISPGSTNRDMVLNVDFAPTLLELAGVASPESMQGRSFAAMLSGPAPADWRRSMYYRYYLSHFQTEPHCGVRTRTHKLIHFDRIGQWELYDLAKDPEEMRNLAEDPAHAETLAALKKELARLQTQLGDDPSDFGENPRTGFEK